MQLRQRTAVAVMGGALVFAIGGFLVRGFSQVFVTADTAYTLAAPLFLVGGVLAVIAVVLSVLVKIGLVTLDGNH